MSVSVNMLRFAAVAVPAAAMAMFAAIAASLTGCSTGVSTHAEIPME